MARSSGAREPGGRPCSRSSAIASAGALRASFARACSATRAAVRSGERSGASSDFAKVNAFSESPFNRSVSARANRAGQTKSLFTRRARAVLPCSALSSAAARFAPVGDRRARLSCMRMVRYSISSPKRRSSAVVSVPSAAFGPRVPGGLAPLRSEAAVCNSVSAECVTCSAACCCVSESGSSRLFQNSVSARSHRSVACRDRTVTQRGLSRCPSSGAIDSSARVQSSRASASEPASAAWAANTFDSSTARIAL